MSTDIPEYWSSEDIERLSHLSNAEVAQHTGYSLEEVARVRLLLKRRAMWSELNRNRAINWSADNIALLGTLSDQEIAHLLGCSRQAVAAKRTKLNIAPYKPSGLQWTNDLILQLGRSSDRQVAENIGVSMSTIFSKRKSQGIRAHRVMLTWTPEAIAQLGTCPDGQLAQRLGCSRKSIVQKRKALGISAYVRLKNN
jgi:biotin operon repressor